MKIYFLARFDLVLSIEDSSICIKSGDIVYLEDIPKQQIFVNSKNKYCDNYTFRLEESLNNELDYVCVWKISSGYLIELKPKYIFMPMQIDKQIIDFEDDMYLVEIHKNNLIQVFTSKGNFVLNKVGFKEFTYEVKTISKKLLFLQFDFEECKFYYIFEKNNLIFYGFVEEVNIKENHLIILCADKSCYGQKRVIDFNIKDDKQEEYYVYGDDRELYTKINNINLFLDAVKIKSFELYEKYLSEELQEINKQDFLAFFEDFEDYRFIENECLLEKNNEVIKVVHFEVLNNIITNIYD